MSALRPVVMVLSGTAIVKNNQMPKGKEIVAELRAGDIFGESDLLRYPGIDFFGDIYAGPLGLDCLVIVGPETMINHYERDALRKVFLHRHSTLLSQIERNFKEMDQLGQY